MRGLPDLVFAEALSRKTPVDSSGGLPFFPELSTVLNSGAFFRSSRVVAGLLFVHMSISEDIHHDFLSKIFISIISGPSSDKQPYF